MFCLQSAIKQHLRKHHKSILEEPFIALFRCQNKGGFTQNAVTACEPAYGQRQLEVSTRLLTFASLYENHSFVLMSQN